MGVLRSPSPRLCRAHHRAGCDDGDAGHPRLRRVTRGCILIAVAATTLVGLHASLAGAAGLNLVVNDASDRLDSTPGDGACRTSVGTCTLRAAVQEANASPGADAIQVPSGTYAIAIPPLNQNDITTGDLDITDSLTIVGAGVGNTIVDGGIPTAGAPSRVRGLDRIFEVLVDEGTIAFSNLTFTDGYAAEFGGAVMNNSTATVTVTASTLMGNVAEKAGGAIDNHLGGSVHVRDSALSNNVAFESGSALNNNRGGTVTLTNTTISSNSAADVGLDDSLVGAGAVANNAELDARGTITVTRSQFFENRSGGGRPGAAISNDGAGILIVDHTTFSKNRSDGDGGAIFNGTGDVTVTDSTFSENAGTDGGAVGSKGGSATVLDSSFSKNSAKDWGGGVMVGNQGGATVRNTSFIENTGLNGGGIATEGSGLVIVENSTFTKNSAVDTAALSTGEGGGMHSNSGGEVVVTGGLFSENKAHAGGGLSNEGGGVVTITGTRFSANVSEAQGGGVLVEGGDVRMVEIDVVHNVSESPEEGGGGISYAGDKSVTAGESAAIEDSRILDNKSASEGGGIDSRGDGPLLIATTAITGNTAAVGGAIHHVGDATLAVTRSTLSGNVAENGGGVFTDGDGEATIDNATVSGNRAGKFGGGLLVSSRLVVRSSTVANNLAASGGGINNGGGDLIGDGSVFLRNAIVANNPAGGNCVGTITSLGGNVENSDSCQLRDLSDQPGTDPLLGPLADNGGPTQTHALLADSPAQDNAVCSELEPCPSLDQRGVERPKVGGFDVGAFESELLPGGGAPQCAGRTERPLVADSDSWIAQGSAAANFGSDGILKVSSNERALVHFPLPTVPPGCKVVGATLRLYASAATDGRTLEALRVTSDWSEAGVTWSNQPAVSGPAAATESGLGFREWDVLAQTRDMYTFGSHGFLIRDAVEGATGAQQSFHSHEKGIDRPPELVLVFDDPDAPPRTGVCPKTPQLLSADRDSWVSQGSPSNNFGTDSTLKVKSQVGSNSRALVRFPLPALPPGCTTVSSAVLRLEASSAKEGRTLEALQVASGWSETGVTWSNQPSTTSSAAVTASAQGPLEWMVTEHVLGMYTSANQGFLVRDADEDGNGDEQTLNSREKLNDLAPELVFVFDDSTPATTIDSGPDSPIDETAATFSFFSDRGDATFECSLDGTGFRPCMSPNAIEGLTEGHHRLEVRATRPVRAVDPTPASYVWTVDVTAPESEIISGPADPTNETAASIAFSAADNLDASGQLRLQCRLDDEPAFTACSSPAEYADLAAGRHTFQVRALDRAGNVGAPVEHSWTVDLTPPESAIGAGPADPTNETSAAFSLTGSDNLDAPVQLRFQCRLDAALESAWADCSSPARSADLAEGGHSFQLRAIDRAGNVDASPDDYAWTIDLTAPTATITAGPVDPTNETAASLSFTGSDTLDELGQLSFQCRLDSAAEPDWQGCSSPQAYELLAEGEHRFQVRARDRAGNVGAAADYVWTVDVTAPGAELTDKPADPSNDASPSLAFSANEVATFECKLDFDDYAACESPHDLLGLSEGEHSFQVRATDLAGNQGDAAGYSWIVDTRPPDTTINEAPQDPTNETSARFEFAADEASSFACSLDNGPYEVCMSPYDYPVLAPGPHVFRVQASDEAANLEAAPAEHAWTIDVSEPETVLNDKPPATTTSTSATFTFASEPGATFECRLDSEAFASCESPKTYLDLAVGEHRFQVRAQDAAGNRDSSPATHDWTVEAPAPSDTTAPETTIGSGPADPTNESSATLSFTGSDDLSAPSALRFQCRLDSSFVADWASCSSPRSYSALGAGHHTFEVRAIDGAGNVDDSPAGRSWTIDLTAPETTIDSGPSGLTNDSTPTYGFSSEPGATFQCRVDAAPFVGCTSPHTTASLSDEAHTFEVRATDAAGNVDDNPASRSITVDTVAPQTTIDSAPPTRTMSTGATFTFSSESGATFECALDAAAFATCTSPRHFTGLAAGRHEFRVRAKDAAGNTDATPVSHSWTIDTSPPETTIVEKPPASTTTSSATFTFSSTEAGSTFECALDAAPFESCTSPKEYSGLAIGGHEFRVRATDAAGNTDASPASHSWTIQAPGTCAGPSTVTAVASGDAWLLQSSPSSNYGNDSVVKVDTKAGANARSLFRFTLPPIPSGCRVTDAKLRLYASSYKSGRTLEAVQVAASWTESRVTWSNQPTTTGAAATALSPSTSTYVQWSVNVQVESMYAGGNHGFLIRDSVENGNGIEQGFHSREKGADNSPQLLITFG
jgi:hypothetical protein